MTVHDTWARLTPYELGIPGRAFTDEYFSAIREEAEARGSDPSDPGAFILLGQVGRAIREIQGGERGEEALHRFGAFLFHAFHFHTAGEPLLLVETPVIRYLVEGDPSFPDWQGTLPAAAGYLQLPRNLVWSHASDSEHAEPLDGIFWSRAAGDSLSLLVGMGVRDDRPGLSVTELPPVPLEDAPTWIDVEGREEEADFRTTLPGGELDRLYSVVTLAEALKLVSRIFAYVESVPGALGEVEHPPRPTDPDERGEGAYARPSALPFRRVRLEGERGSRDAPSTADEEERDAEIHRRGDAQGVEEEEA